MAVRNPAEIKKAEDALAKLANGGSHEKGSDLFESRDVHFVDGVAVGPLFAFRRMDGGKVWRGYWQGASDHFTQKDSCRKVKIEIGKLMRAKKEADLFGAPATPQPAAKPAPAHIPAAHLPATTTGYRIRPSKEDETVTATIIEPDYSPLSADSVQLIQQGIKKAARAGGKAGQIIMDATVMKAQRLVFRAGGATNYAGALKDAQALVTRIRRNLGDEAKSQGRTITPTPTPRPKAPSPTPPPQRVRDVAPVPVAAAPAPKVVPRKRPKKWGFTLCGQTRRLLIKLPGSSQKERICHALRNVGDATISTTGLDGNKIGDKGVRTSVELPKDCIVILSELGDAHGGTSSSVRFAIRVAASKIGEGEGPDSMAPEDVVERCLGRIDSLLESIAIERASIAIAMKEIKDA